MEMVKRKESTRSKGEDASPDNNENDVSWGAETTTAALNGRSDTLTIDEAIHRLGFGKFQWIVFFAVGLCMAADAMEVTLLSYLSAILKEEWNLTGTESAAITSSVFAGQLVGSLFLGPLGDRIGRRPVFILAGSIISIFGLLTSVAWNVASLVILRMLVGVGVGGLVVPFDILAEFLPVENRGTFLLSCEYFWTVGSLMVTIFAFYTFGSGGSWIGFVILCALPCFVAVFFAVCFVPESPRWLVAEGRKEEALVVLRTAALRNGEDPDIMFPPGTELADDIEEENSNFSELLKPKWRKLTLLLWAAWFCMAFGYYGTILAVTRVFSEEAQDAEGHLSFNYEAIFISSAAEFAGLTFVVLLVDKIGRVFPMTLNFFLGGSFVLALSLLAGRGDEGSFSLTATAFMARAVEMGASCLLWTSTAEVLSTEIRTTGHSASNAMARLGGFLCPFLVEGDTSFTTVGITMFLVHILAALCTSYMPETKGLELGQVPHGSSALRQHAPNKQSSQAEQSLVPTEDQTGAPRNVV